MFFPYAMVSLALLVALHNGLELGVGILCASCHPRWFTWLTAMTLD